MVVRDDFVKSGSTVGGEADLTVTTTPSGNTDVVREAPTTTTVQNRGPSALTGIIVIVIALIIGAMWG